MPNKIVTLFIKDTGIYVLGIRGMRAEKWAVLPLEPGLVSQGVVQDEAQVASKIQELLRLAEIRTRRVVVALTGVNSLYRTISMPQLPENMIPEAVKREARGVIPVPLDQVYLAYQSIPAPRGETRLFLTSFLRTEADSLFRTLKLAGLDPYLVDLAPLVLCQIPNEPRAIIVDTGPERLGVMVMSERVPQLIRSVSLPGEATSLSEKLSTIAEEFNRTISFYNSSHLESPLEATVPVFISGDLALEPEHWQLVVGRLNSKISLLPSPIDYPDSFPVNEFMVNIGLTLKEISRKGEASNSSLINFNALPESYRSKPVPLGRIILPIGAAIGIGLLVYLGVIVQGSRAYTESLREQVPILEGRIAQNRQQLMAANIEIERIGAQFAPLKATGDIFDNQLNSLQRTRSRVDEDLSECMRLEPSTTSLTLVHHSSDEMTLTGTEEDYATIFEYARELRSSGRFSPVIISHIKLEEKESQVTYKFEFTLKSLR